MPARCSEAVLEIIAQPVGRFLCTTVIAECIVSGYAAAPTAPASGISFTTGVVEVITQADAFRGARIGGVYLELITSGECIPVTLSGGSGSGGNFGVN